jgi:uroporphyrin-III C-methyltransferase
MTTSRHGKTHRQGLPDRRRSRRRRPDHRARCAPAGAGRRRAVRRAGHARDARAVRQAELISVGKRSGQRSTAQDAINAPAGRLRLQIRHRRAPERRRPDAVRPRRRGIAGARGRGHRGRNRPRHHHRGGRRRRHQTAPDQARRRPQRRLLHVQHRPDQPDHPALPHTDTMVQYMGGREAAATAERLLAQGRRADTPVVVVENCSRVDERIERLRCRTWRSGLHAAHGPVLVMIGEALRLREHQPALASTPLTGTAAPELPFSRRARRIPRFAPAAGRPPRGCRH